MLMNQFTSGIMAVEGDDHDDDLSNEESVSRTKSHHNALVVEGISCHL